MSDQKGLSYVSQIKTAYTDLIKANGTRLVCALRFGDLLNQAQEAVGKGGAWKPWLSLHCPEISHSTAIIYMRLAKNRAAIEEISQHAAKTDADQDLSIRAAIKAVNAALGKTETTASKPKKNEGQSDDAEDDDAQVLASLDVDAVLRGMGECWDAQQRRKLLEEQIKSVQPWELALSIENIWDDDKRKSLVQELSRHSASEPPASEPPVVTRRKLPGRASTGDKVRAGDCAAMRAALRNRVTLFVWVGVCRVSILVTRPLRPYHCC